MHRALSVSEILVEIFINLDQLPSSSGVGWTHSLTQKSLASLARTCTTFHELAMDLLWATMPGLRPLFGCVTRLHPVIYDPTTKYSWSQDVDPLAEHEFHEFLRHSARVRIITISANTYFHLLTALPIEPCVFPGLLSLFWTVQRTNTGDFRFFLSPTLRRCYVSELHPDLRCIGTRCAALEQFTVQEDSNMTQLWETVRSCTRLRRLQCSAPLDSAAWMHLSTIPTLLEVKILTSQRIIHYPLNHLNFATFLNLTTLAFRGIEVEAVVTIIQHFKFPSLKEFEMHIRVLLWAEAEQLFRALSQCKASQTLEHINISSHDRIQEHTSDSLTAVRQFLCFRQLRTLRYLPITPYSSTTTFFSRAMTSWPHIRSLSLVDWHLCPPTVTFRGLFAALRLCPRLEDLQVSIDARNIDIEPEAESFQHTSLKNLTVGSYEPQDVNVKAIARIIFSMLPAVDRVICASRNVPRVWKDVNRHLELLRNRPSSAPSRYLTGAALDMI
ncbi:hypothetical protein DFJ58DRAFT_765584 [Suillus subalutaceus]|uniref:uncharacterized protein n=1 Tax=Suillus subalutaceus TaxID=48586 RepID=UPI001B861797|nr:uncharacterized protein DFJ58DRAFT_765584 [Suillus subalutaceus]KAG1869363.1 hypothetical protein DFJ58DRAFT_765584 [Suillus subalutaceus]